jgi:hypothetical protein
MESRKNLKPLRPQKKSRKERKGLNTTKQWSTPYRRVQSGMCSRSWGIFAGLVVLLFCFSVTTARGQQISQPQKLPVGMNPSPASLPHRFWDRTNTLLFAGVGVFRGLDYASTRNMQARGREEILLPDDVVNNSAAFAGVEAGGTAASVGLSYLMHRTGHHKLERWVSIAHIGVTGFGAARNYALKTHRASAP